MMAPAIDSQWDSVEVGGDPLRTRLPSPRLV